MEVKKVCTFEMGVERMWGWWWGLEGYGNLNSLVPIPTMPPSRFLYNTPSPHASHIFPSGFCAALEIVCVLRMGPKGDGGLGVELELA